MAKGSIRFSFSVLVWVFSGELNQPWVFAWGVFLLHKKDPGEQPLCANPLRLECGGFGVARFKIDVARGGFGTDFRQWRKKRCGHFLAFLGWTFGSLG